MFIIPASSANGTPWGFGAATSKPVRLSPIVLAGGLVGVGSWFVWCDLVQQRSRHGGRDLLAGVPALGVWLGLAGDLGRHY